MGMREATTIMDHNKGFRSDKKGERKKREGKKGEGKEREGKKGEGKKGEEGRGKHTHTHMLTNTFTTHITSTHMQAYTNTHIYVNMRDGTNIYAHTHITNTHTIYTYCIYKTHCAPYSRYVSLSNYKVLRIVACHVHGILNMHIHCYNVRGCCKSVPFVTIRLYYTVCFPFPSARLLDHMYGDKAP